MPRLRDRAVRGLHRLGWLLAGRLPATLTRALIGTGSRLGVRLKGRHVRTLRDNLGIATGGPVSDTLLRSAIASYLRMLFEVWALPHWPADRVLTDVRISSEEVLRAAYAERGAVVTLPHSGNWDLAGAWACRTGMPVSTVAEQLSDEDFAAYVRFRRGLGMEVHSHRDRQAMAALADAVRRGRLVCLVADRDLSGTGVPVRWRGQPITMPAGPAIVARLTGAALLPAVCHYTGQTMTVTLGPVIPAQPGRDGLIAMTQQAADFFAEQIARQPQDWHMLQPFFHRVDASTRPQWRQEGSP